jgi:pre-mRNA-splicing factor CWC22
MIHRLETNKLRNVSKFFAHLLITDALPWTCLEYVHLNEEETTSSSRIFIKILMQEVSESLGMVKLKQRFNDPYMEAVFKGIFPKDNPRNTRFAINYWTSIGMSSLSLSSTLLYIYLLFNYLCFIFVNDTIVVSVVVVVVVVVVKHLGLGALTDGLRIWLKEAPKRMMAQQLELAKQQELMKKERGRGYDSDSSSSSGSSGSSSSSSSSDSSSSSSGSSSSSDSSSSSSGSSSSSDSDSSSSSSSDSE